MTESAERWRRALAIVDTVLDLDTTERERAIDAACAGDLGLADDVRRWLASRHAAEALGDWSAVASPAIAELGAPLAAGTRLGAWQVVRVAGSGGMGTVYEAVRADGAFERRAAVKVVRHVGDLELLARRLRDERRILAGLDHPNIARLLDGGVTDTGLPWYAMEFVAGTPIGTFADQGHLPVRRRLELVRQVCAAVSYAHRRLVVHRDLKPSNILVTPDGEVKLLDFGIATLLEAPSGAPGAPRTLTAMLTPEYASPEQRRGEPATVAADVYSLGVVLHELVVGRRPALDAEGEPALPSSRVSDDAALARGTSRGALQRQVRGDVDILTQAALRPDPARRYPAVDALDSDIANHLAGLPLKARPDTLGYRLGKFVRRHRAGTALGVLACLGIALAVLAALAQARRAAREAQAAARSAAFVVGLLELSYPYDSGGTAQSLRSMLDSGAARAIQSEREGIAVPTALLEALALGYNGQARYARAITLDSMALARRIAALEPDSLVAFTRWGFAESLRLGGRQRDALAEYQRVYAWFVAAEGVDAPVIARLLQSTARAWRSVNRLDVADTLLDRVEAILARHPTQGRIARAHAHQTRGHIALERGDLDRAGAEYQAALDLRRAVGASVLEDANSQEDLAAVALRRGDLRRADSLLTIATRVKRERLGDLHPEVGDALVKRAALAHARHDERSARQLYEGALTRYAGAGAIPQWRHAPALVGLAHVAVAQRRPREADSLLAIAIGELAALEAEPSSLHRDALALRASLHD